MHISKCDSGRSTRNSQIFGAVSYAGRKFRRIEFSQLDIFREVCRSTTFKKAQPRKFVIKISRSFFGTAKISFRTTTLDIKWKYSKILNNVNENWMETIEITSLLTVFIPLLCKKDNTFSVATFPVAFLAYGHPPSPPTELSTVRIPSYKKSNMQNQRWIWSMFKKCWFIMLLFWNSFFCCFKMLATSSFMLGFPCSHD